MRNLILSALILASAFQTAKAEADGNWIYSVENNQATITRYMGFGPVVNIPSEVNGIAVTKIGAGSSSPFRPPPPSTGYVNPYITSITIPNTVTIIGPTAFGNLVGLTSITIPNSVTSIEMNAFYGCTGLTTITIPSNVTSIGSNAFQNCTGLTSITIPNSVTSIGGNAFSGCTGLTTITIPNSVTSIEAGAFSGCTRLTSISSSPALATDLKYAGVVGQVASDAIVQSIANALASDDAFVTAVANKIKGTAGNYGIATQSGVTSSIASVINEGRIAGVASVTASPNTWSLFTTSQIQNMAVDDLVLTRLESGGFVLNYDIEQSTDLQNWTRYEALSLPLTRLPTDKAFVRIKAKQ